jgi:hypothetical protein
MEKSMEKIISLVCISFLFSKSRVIMIDALFSCDVDVVPLKDNIAGLWWRQFVLSTLLLRFILLISHCPPFLC